MAKAVHASDKDRRSELINATIETIADFGLSDLTLAKVASHAGLSPGIVNFYFDSKKQLLIDTLSFLEDEFNEVLSEHILNCRSARDRLKAIVCANFDKRVFSKKKIAVWYAFWGESQARQDYRAVCGRSDDATGRTIRDLYAEILSSDHSDIEPSARGLEGVMEGLWQESLYGPGEPNPDTAISLCDQYLNMTLDGAGDVPHPETVDDSETVDLLAPWTYRSEELLELEIERLFRPSWMLAGHISDVPLPGSYITLDAIGERALVVRGDDSTLRAFHNVCRHRGARIVEGTGRCGSQGLMCPFHGWRYRLDGSLQFVPGKSQGFDSVDENAYGLVPLDLEVWNGFIFVRFASGGPSVAQEMQPVESLVAPYRLEQLQPQKELYCDSNSSLETYPYNWKLFVDVDNEGYHVPVGHPSLQQLYGNGYRDTEIGGVPVSYGPFNDKQANLWSVRNYRKLLPEFDHLSSEQRNLWLYVAMFPNTVFGLYPDMMETYQVLPISARECQVSSKIYALPDDRRQVHAARYLNRRINRETEREDRSFMKWLQQGLSSSAYPKWTLSEVAETGVAAYHRKFQQALPVAKLASEPAAGNVARLNETLTGSGPGESE